MHGDLAAVAGLRDIGGDVDFARLEIHQAGAVGMVCQLNDFIACADRRIKVDWNRGKLLVANVGTDDNALDSHGREFLHEGAEALRGKFNWISL